MASFSSVQFYFYLPSFCFWSRPLLLCVFKRNPLKHIHAVKKNKVTCTFFLYQLPCRLSVVFQPKIQLVTSSFFSNIKATLLPEQAAPHVWFGRFSFSSWHISKGICFSPGIKLRIFCLSGKFVNHNTIEKCGVSGHARPHNRFKRTQQWHSPDEPPIQFVSKVQISDYIPHFNSAILWIVLKIFM